MYATSLTCSNTDTSKTLTMNHALAQVSFYVYKENYSGTGSFTKFKIEDADTASTSFIKTSSTTDLTMDITDGTIAGGSVGSLTRTLADAVTLSETIPDTDADELRDQVNATTLTVPTTTISSGDIKFTFTIDDVDYEITNSTEVTWEKGQQYIYTILLKGTELAISEVTVTDWSPVTGDDLTIN